MTVGTDVPVVVSRPRRARQLAVAQHCANVPKMVRQLVVLLVQVARERRRRGNVRIDVDIRLRDA